RPARRRGRSKEVFMPCFRDIRVVVMFVCACFSAPLLLAQSSAIQITGDVPRSLSLTAADLAKLPRASAKVNDQTYEGVWLAEVLRAAGVPTGVSLRGKALSTYVLAEADDGYAVVFSLGELDLTLTEGQILLADSTGGKPLSENEGAFRLV